MASDKAEWGTVTTATCLTNKCQYKEKSKINNEEQSVIPWTPENRDFKVLFEKKWKLFKANVILGNSSDPNVLRSADHHYFKWPSRSTNQVFTLFRKLPKELQLLVWEHTLPESAVIKVTSNMKGLDTYRAASDDIQTFFDLCDESGKIYKAHYRQLQIDVRDPEEQPLFSQGPVYIDEARDTLLMDSTTFRMACEEEIKIDLSCIQNFATEWLPSPHFRRSPQGSRGYLVLDWLMKHCPALQNFHLVANEMSDTYCPSSLPEKKHLFEIHDLKHSNIKQKNDANSFHRAYFYDISGFSPPSKARFVEFTHDSNCLDSWLNWAKKLQKQITHDTNEDKEVWKDVKIHTSFIGMLEKFGEVYYWVQNTSNVLADDSEISAGDDIVSNLQYFFLKPVAINSAGHVYFKDIPRELRGVK